jgi:hypothetical protein
MAVVAKWYGLAIRDQWGGPTGATVPVNWITDANIKVALTTAAYAYNQDTDEFYSVVTNELATAGGYTSGGVVLGTKTCTYDTASNESRLGAANASWASATFTCQVAVIYKYTGTTTTSPLQGFVDMGAAQSVSSGTFTIQWDATGVLKGTAA